MVTFSGTYNYILHFIFCSRDLFRVLIIPINFTYLRRVTVMPNYEVINYILYLLINIEANYEYD